MTYNTLQVLLIFLLSLLATDILIHGSIHSYVCYCLMVRYSSMISLSDVSIEHILNVHI